MTGRAVAIAIAAVLLAGAVAAFVFFSREPPKTPMISVRSHPDGARVRFAGVDVGQTPLYSDNRYRAGRVKVELSMPGFHDWTGELDGGEDVALEVTLTRPQPKIAIELVAMDAGVRAAPVPEPEWKDPDLEDEAKAEKKQ